MVLFAMFKNPRHKWHQRTKVGYFIIRRTNFVGRSPNGNLGRILEEQKEIRINLRERIRKTQEKTEVKHFNKRILTRSAYANKNFEYQELTEEFLQNLEEKKRESRKKEGRVRKEGCRTRGREKEGIMKKSIRKQEDVKNFRWFLRSMY